jgi:hypothetical protein
MLDLDLTTLSPSAALRLDLTALLRLSLDNLQSVAFHPVTVTQIAIKIVRRARLPCLGSVGVAVPFK